MEDRKSKVSAARIKLCPSALWRLRKRREKEMKGLRREKLSFIKRKIGSCLSECNISTDSFGGNISSSGKNSIKSRRWGRKVEEGDREWKRKEERRSENTLTSVGKRREEEKEREEKYEKFEEQKVTSGPGIEIFTSYRAVLFHWRRSILSTWPLQNSISLIDRHGRL